MIHRILPLLNKLIPIDIARRAINKIDPRMGKFVTNAVAAGYTADSAMDFIRDQIQPEESQEKGFRPDEKAAEERVRHSNQVGNIAKTAGSVALGGTIAGSAVPTVIGNLFQNKNEQSSEEQQRQEALNQFNQKKAKRQQSELNPDALMKQYQQNYGQNGQMGQNSPQGKADLLRSMKEITEYLKQLKGQNG